MAPYDKGTAMSTELEETGGRSKSAWFFSDGAFGHRRLYSQTAMTFIGLTAYPMLLLALIGITAPFNAANLLVAPMMFCINLFVKISYLDYERPQNLMVIFFDIAAIYWIYHNVILIEGGYNNIFYLAGQKVFILAMVAMLTWAVMTEWESMKEEFYRSRRGISDQQLYMADYYGNIDRAKALEAIEGGAAEGAGAPRRINAKTIVKRLLKYVFLIWVGFRALMLGGTMCQSMMPTVPACGDMIKMRRSFHDATVLGMPVAQVDFVGRYLDGVTDSFSTIDNVLEGQIERGGR